ncbi:uncharacterized protein LOC127855321 isoform X2 [Dreissena polymorpha]|nr:uncharacterized protein LOC127855321 isoform X2 [Dreissena polymorpha]
MQLYKVYIYLFQGLWFLNKLMATVPNSQDSDPLMNIFGSGRLSINSQESVSAEKTCTKTTGPFGMHSKQHRKSRNVKSKYGMGRNNGLYSEPAGGQNDGEKAGEGSQDLFSSQSSCQRSLLNNQIDITLQLTEYMWVQCDNPDCQKWRRIQATASGDLGNTAWYCHMNPDRHFDSCAAREEDHALYDRMAKKAGIKYVMSALSEGSLVWAKMSGYCKWPAIITPDPACRLHMFADLDGDPLSYHVEFLGNPHSHSWVAAKFVSVYGHKALSEIDDSQSQNRDSDVAKLKRGCRRGQGRSRSVLKGRQRKSYLRIHIEDVIEEADFLLGLAPEERLPYCTFTPSKQDKHIVLSKAKQPKSCDQCGQHTAKKRKREDSKTQKHQNFHHKKSTVITMAHEPGKKPRGKENRPTICDYSSEVSEVSQDEGISVPTFKTEGSQLGFDSPEQFSQSKLRITNTLVGKTKEEKYSMDLDMYKKNERAFEHDVYRFMLRHGRKIRSIPIWHNVPVRLFQVFLAVHERGGFDQVTRKKQWNAIFKELTEQHNVTSGVQAKKFYLRNLYPYELYMSGKDFKSCFSNISSSSTSGSGTRTVRKSDPGVRSAVSVTPGVKRSRSVTTGVKSSRSGVQSEGAEAKSEVVASWEKPQGESLSQDIADLLGELNDGSEKTDKYMKKRTVDGLSLGFKYHDQSTPSESHGCVPSEFHPTSLTGISGSSQRVPDCIGEGEGESSSCGDLADIENKILHEMRALEEDMKNFTGDL